MTKKSVLLVLVFVILAMSQFACGRSEEVKDNLTVDAVVENQTENVKEGPVCEYTFISTDIQHRLNHYRVCYDENGNDAKRIKALEKAIENCVELCNDTFDAGCDDNTTCIKQCNDN